MTARSLAIADSGEPGRLLGAAISWDLFFPTLGVSPALGRLFGPRTIGRAPNPLVILSDDICSVVTKATRHYRPQPLRDGRPHTVIGVMPPQFAFPENHKAWIPLAPSSKSCPERTRAVSSSAVQAGHRRGGAQAELSAVAAKIAG